MNTETLIGIALGFMVIMAAAIIADHVEAVREYERRK